MNVYPLTHVDRDLLLAGADLEAVLAEREREKLERDERTQDRLGAEATARLGHQAPRSGGRPHAPSKPASA